MTLPTGEQRLKRIVFLAEVRNRALRPLEDPKSPAYSTRFDKLLYLNDVVFNTADVANLLFSTNLDETTGKTRYDAACAVDFINAFKFYDTFATRDLEGYSMGIPFYPWFTAAGKAESRQDVLTQVDAVRVRSCWGGMVAFEAKWFQQRGGLTLASEVSMESPAEQHETITTTASISRSTSSMAATATSVDYHHDVDKNLNWGLATPNIVAPPQSTGNAGQDGNLNWHWAKPPQERSLNDSQSLIRFRATTDTFWDSSECCLIHADLQAARGVSGTGETGIFMNPYVRVAYDANTLSWLAFTRRFERLYPIIHRVLTNMVGFPGFNPRRTEEAGELVTDRVWMYDDPNYLTSGDFKGAFKDVERIALPGGFCGSRKLLALGEGKERGSWFFAEIPPDDPATVGIIGDDTKA